MALEATHMRFVLDLKEEYGVRDPKKYISGDDLSRQQVYYRH
jgi:hypothetical protein